MMYDVCERGKNTERLKEREKKTKNKNNEYSKERKRKIFLMVELELVAHINFSNLSDAYLLLVHSVILVS